MKIVSEYDTWQILSNIVLSIGVTNWLLYIKLLDIDAEICFEEFHLILVFYVTPFSDNDSK